MIKVKRLHPDAQLPKSSHPGYSLGYDIYSIEDVTLYPGQQVTISTGIAMQHYQKEYGFIIENRSGLGNKGLMVLGGVIDCDYTGEIKVMLLNTKPGLPHYIYRGDRIAQARPVPCLTDTPIDWSDELDITDRGESGFGSTGR